MTIRTTPAVVVTCDRCGWQSEPANDARAAQLAARHEDDHAMKDLRAKWAQRGHEVTEVAEWIDMDDSSGHARCSCGWRSRSGKVNWMGVFADRHIAELEAAEARS